MAAACSKANRTYTENVHRLMTPLLRRVYIFFALFVAVYLASLALEFSSWNKERLYRKLLSGDQTVQASAGFDLAYLQGESQLLRALKSPLPSVRAVAMSSLWDLWSHAAGHKVFREVQL